jgi:hypothetical protein
MQNKEEQHQAPPGVFWFSLSNCKDRQRLQLGRITVGHVFGSYSSEDSKVIYEVFCRLPEITGYTLPAINGQDDCIGKSESINKAKEILEQAVERWLSRAGENVLVSRKSKSSLPKIPAIEGNCWTEERLNKIIGRWVFVGFCDGPPKAVLVGPSASKYDVRGGILGFIPEKDETLLINSPAQIIRIGKKPRTPVFKRVF